MENCGSHFSSANTDYKLICTKRILHNINHINRLKLATLARPLGYINARKQFTEATGSNNLPTESK